MDKDVIKDAISLCDRAIRTKGDNAIFERGFREISIEKVRVHEFQTEDDDGDILYYMNSETPFLLQRNGVLDMDELFSDSRNTSKRRMGGYFEVLFDYEKAQEWLNKAINQLLKKQKNQIVIPEGKDYLYENGIFAIALQNGMMDAIDLSNSPIAKPVFDTLYALYKNSPQPFFSKKEILEEYEKITYDNIDWSRFTKMVSDVRKRIDKKPTFKKRLILRFDDKRQSYEFRILPLSSSDK